VSGFLSIIVGAVFGLWGYHKRLFPAWALIFNVLVAVYLSVMLTPAFADKAGGYASILGPWSNCAILVLIFAIYLALSELLSKFYLTNTYCVSFPKWVDSIGGAFCGFLAGYIIATFFFFALASSPIKNNAYISKYVPKNNGTTAARACGFISSFSLQSSDTISQALDKIKTLPIIVKNISKDISVKPAEKKSIQVTQNQPAEHKVMDVNEKTGQISFRKEVNTDVNDNLVVNQQPIHADTNQIAPIKTVPADHNTVKDSNENKEEVKDISVKPTQGNRFERRPGRGRLQNPLSN
jgi:hypothetical protein